MNDTDSLGSSQRIHHSKDEAIQRIICKYNSGELKIEDLEPVTMNDQPRTGRKTCTGFKQGKRRLLIFIEIGKKNYAESKNHGVIMMLEQANRKLMRKQEEKKHVLRKSTSPHLTCLKGKKYFRNKLDLHRSLNKSPMPDQLGQLQR